MLKESMLGGALAEVAGPLKDFTEKLGGEEGERWLSEFKCFLRKEKTWLKFQTFRTIKLGTPGLKTADDFRKTIKDGGMEIGDWANDILGKPQFTVAAEETEADLVIVSVAELGFKKGATREDIYAKAKELGLELCPNEVGPQLRLQYADQANSEWLIIGMEPIAASGGRLGLFRVGRSGNGLWLSIGAGSPGGVWLGYGRFVFVRPRK